MTDLTIEQKRALALAKARKAAEQSRGKPANAMQMVPRGMGENIPILGPLVAGAADTVGSHIASWMTGRSPEEERARAKERMAADREPLENQIGYGAGAFMGMVGPLAQIGASGPVAARVLGMSGGLPSQVGFGAGSGYVISAADALARGDDLGEANTQGLWGAALGGALPIAGAGFNAARAAITGKPLVSSDAVLARAIRDDQIPVDQLMDRLSALGPDAVLADLGPNLQRQAGALASLPGEGQRIVRDALMERAQGTNARIIGDVNATLGPAPVPSQVQAVIREGQEALGPAYGRVFANARAVDTTPIAENLDALAVNLRGDAQKAAQQVRRMLNVAGEEALDPDPSTLFQVRQAIDGMMATEANPQVIRVLSQTRQQVDDTLAAAVPGIKDVDAQFAELARQNEALGRGQQMLDSGRTAPRPDEAAAEMTQGALPQGAQVGPSAVPFRLSQGARAEIERIIGTTANDLNALKTALKGDGSWNRSRLVSLFGEGKADRLLDVLERERTFAQTANVVLQNSETAARQAAQAEVNAGQPASLQGLTMTGLIASALQKGANMGAAWRQSGVNARVAEALMSRPDAAMTMAVRRELERRGITSRLAPAGTALVVQALMGQ